MNTGLARALELGNSRPRCPQDRCQTNVHNILRILCYNNNCFPAKVIPLGFCKIPESNSETTLRPWSDTLCSGSPSTKEGTGF